MNEAQLTKLAQHYYALGQQAALGEVGLLHKNAVPQDRTPPHSPTPRQPAGTRRT